MFKFVSTGLLAISFSMNSHANSTTCQVIEKECEHAVALGNALAPYVGRAWDAGSATYWKAHAYLKGQIPSQIATLTNSTISEADFREYATHAGLALSAYVVAAATFAAASVPLSLVKLPFRNRATMFVTGVVAKTIYDAFNVPAQTTPAKTTRE